MTKLIVGIVAAVALGGAAYLYFPGFASRTDVLKEKVVRKIDKLIGETEIQKKEVERSIKNMDGAVSELMRGRIEAEEKAKLQASKVKETEQKVADARKSLEKLQGYVTSESPVDIGGKTYQPKEIREMAQKVLQAHKTLTAELDSRKNAQARMEQVASTLKDREDGVKNKLSALKNRMREMEADIDALKTMQDAARLASDTDDTLGAKFEELEKRVNDLHVKVRTETRIEDEKWKTVEAKKDLDTADKIISATKDADDILTEIRKITDAK